MKFLLHWDNVSLGQNRNVSPAGVNKMDYILSTCSDLGLDVDIITPAMAKKDGLYHKGAKILINDKKSVKYFPSIGKSNVLAKIYNRLSSNALLFLYLLKNVQRNEEIYCYHSLATMKVIKLIKKIKQCKLILEVEEIYSDVINIPREKELKFVDIADKYIFPTQLLNEAINHDNKPYAIVHGNYIAQPQIADKFDDGKKHIVYAGTLDPRKGGASSTAAAAEFLNEEYVVHILGFGNQEQQDFLLKIIKNVEEKTLCKVIFEGVKEGEEYTKFIQSCDIGLSTQNPNAAFNETSFPSKVLSYLANGLRVVSIKIKALQTSEVNDLVFYYDKDEPLEIANAIKQIDLNQAYDSRKYVNNLNEKCVLQLKQMFDKK